MSEAGKKHYDTVVIGAGHNGLICAAYLARGGQKVLVLEAGEAAGGLAATREFHPGFKASLAHTVSHFSTQIASDLDLQNHGYSLGSPMARWSLSASGDHVILDQGRLSGVSDEDANAYAELNRQLKKYAAFMESVYLKTMPRIGENSLGEMMTFAGIGLRMRLMGEADMREFMRVFALPVRDLMDENFENERLKTLVGWDGLIGGRMAPRSPNSAMLALLYRMCGAYDGEHAVPAGGVEGLIRSLVNAAEAEGVEIRYSAAAERISIAEEKTGLRVTGVELENGEQIFADRVVSSADPKTTFFNLLGARHLEVEFTNRIRRLRSKGYVAKLHLALSGLPAFTGIERPDGRMIIAPELDSIEFAYDDAKYGGTSKNPVMEVVIPSLREPSLAPEGQHLLSAHVMYVPYDLKGGWTDEARAEIRQAAIDTLADYAPGIKEQILHAEMLTPADIESLSRATGGHWHHAEMAVDQIMMMRPTFEAAQYATPIPGLYLCGAGSHPGGGLMGGPGFNAAREILK